MHTCERGGDGDSALPLPLPPRWRIGATGDGMHSDDVPSEGGMKTRLGVVESGAVYSTRVARTAPFRGEATIAACAWQGMARRGGSRAERLQQLKRGASAQAPRPSAPQHRVAGARRKGRGRASTARRCAPHGTVVDEVASKMVARYPMSAPSSLSSRTGTLFRHRPRQVVRCPSTRADGHIDIAPRAVLRLWREGRQCSRTAMEKDSRFVKAQARSCAFLPHVAHCLSFTRAPSPPRHVCCMLSLRAFSPLSRSPTSPFPCLRAPSPSSTATTITSTLLTSGSADEDGKGDTRALFPFPLPFRLVARVHRRYLGLRRGWGTCLQLRQ
ncbi:hypothetical protein K438DRAFT_455819 [Mycena galopus ATCC 62051]|nr:hypothetical protein K438DRAFT_455819 [Mycena galopus ATCC 62051]